MRFLKLAAISVVVLFALLTALTSLLPSHVRISRAIDVHAPPEKILLYLHDLRKWKEWNEFVKQANVNKSKDSVTATLIPTGGLEIRLISQPMDSILTEWKQGNGKTFRSGFVLIPSQTITTVQWYFDFHLEWYPWQKMQSIIYDKEMGPFMENSLANLKRIVETSQ